GFARRAAHSSMEQSVITRSRIHKTQGTFAGVLFRSVYFSFPGRRAGSIHPRGGVPHAGAGHENVRRQNPAGGASRARDRLPQARPRGATCLRLGLVRTQAAYRATGTRLSTIDLEWELNAHKHTQLPWLYQMSTCRNLHLTCRLMVNRGLYAAINRCGLTG